MARKIILFVFALYLAVFTLYGTDKSRVIITTDLGGTDPDDRQSMVHLLVCANMLDIEGIISSQVWSTDSDRTHHILAMIDDYEDVYHNLTRHGDGFPTPEYLRSITKRGQSEATMTGVGAGLDSDGSELIIAAADRDDTRPLWILAWGGMNNVAQAIYKMKHSRSPEDFETFLSKIRIYDILGQDDAGAWIAKLYPQVVYIRNRAVYGWQPEDAWIRKNIQSKLPFGASYPDREWVFEGDSPSFLFLVANGLNDPDNINYGGWGGRFSIEKQRNIPTMKLVKRSGRDETIYDDYYMYGTSGEGAEAIKLWKDALWNDFAARMDWSSTPDYNKANHTPYVVVNGDSGKRPLIINACAGETLLLDARNTYDPDDDDITYNWFVYKEPATYKGNITITGAQSPKCIVDIPADASGKNIHIILEATDNGSPRLTSFRRIVVNGK